MLQVVKNISCRGPYLYKMHKTPWLSIPWQVENVRYLASLKYALRSWSKPINEQTTILCSVIRATQTYVPVILKSSCDEWLSATSLFYILITRVPNKLFLAAAVQGGEQTITLEYITEALNGSRVAA